MGSVLTTLIDWLALWVHSLHHGGDGKNWFENPEWYFEWFISIFLGGPIGIALALLPIRMVQAVIDTRRLRDQTRLGREVPCPRCGLLNVIGKLKHYEVCGGSEVAVVWTQEGPRPVCCQCPEAVKALRCDECGVELTKEIFELRERDEFRTHRPTPFRPIGEIQTTSLIEFKTIGLRWGRGFWRATGAALCLAVFYGAFGGDETGTPTWAEILVFAPLVIALCASIEEREDLVQPARLIRIIERAIFGAFAGFLAVWLMENGLHLFAAIRAIFSGSMSGLHHAESQIDAALIHRDLAFQAMTAGALLGPVGGRAEFTKLVTEKWRVPKRFFALRRFDKKRAALFALSLGAIFAVGFIVWPSGLHWLGFELAAAFKPELRETYRLWWVLNVPLMWCLADQLWKLIPEKRYITWVKTVEARPNPLNETSGTTQRDTEQALR